MHPIRKRSHVLESLCPPCRVRSTQPLCSRVCPVPLPCSHRAGARGLCACRGGGGGRGSAGLPAPPAPDQPQVQRGGVGVLSSEAAAVPASVPLLPACVLLGLHRPRHSCSGPAQMRMLNASPASPLPPPLRQLFCSDFEFLELAWLERELGPAGLPPLLLNKFLQLGRKRAAAAGAGAAVAAAGAAAAAPGAAPAGAAAAGAAGRPAGF